MTNPSPPQPCTQPGLEWAFWSPLRSRDELPQLFNERGLIGCGVEIGTHRGEYALKLALGWLGDHLICIDPWIDDLPGYGDLCGRNRNEDLRAAVELLGDRRIGLFISFMVKTSKEAAAEFPDSSIDFAYIDANHAEPFVRQDIALWWPIVKPGGMLAGHDILKCGKEVDAGIQRAVRDFSVREGVDVWIVREEGDPNFPWSWYAWKEEGKGKAA